MQTTVTQRANEVTLQVPAEGSHLGRNGWCHITALELTITQGKCSLTTINSRGTATNGEMSDIPVESLLALLSALQQQSFAKT